MYFRSINTKYFEHSASRQGIRDWETCEGLKPKASVILPNFLKYDNLKKHFLWDFCEEHSLTLGPEWINELNSLTNYWSFIHYSHEVQESSLSSSINHDPIILSLWREAKVVITQILLMSWPVLTLSLNTRVYFWEPPYVTLSFLDTANTWPREPKEWKC